MKYIKWSQ